MMDCDASLTSALREAFGVDRGIRARVWCDWMTQRVAARVWVEESLQLDPAAVFEWAEQTLGKRRRGRWHVFCVEVLVDAPPAA